MKKNKEISRKFVLVGDGFCGKSTLIAAFYNRKFVHRYEPTIFETFTVNTDAYKKHVKLELWDTAGQEEFSRVRPLSYPEVDAIILCFSIDSRESSQNISETWLPEIKHFCSHKIPIVLVATKIDLRLNLPNSNRQFYLKEEHLFLNNSLNNINKICSPTNNKLSLNYNLKKTIALYCCKHGRLCTCYHSRICAKNCLKNDKSTSSNCLIRNIEKECVDKKMITNRLIESKTRDSLNIEDSFSSSEDVEELSNSSSSLNNQDRISSSSCNNSIYRHNQSLLNTLIHKAKGPENSLSNSETESDDEIKNEEILFKNLNFSKTNSSKLKFKNFKFTKNYEKIIDEDINNNDKTVKNKFSLTNLDKSSLLKEKKTFFKSSNIKHKLTTLINNNLNSLKTTKSEKKLPNIFVNSKKYSSSSTSLPFSLMYNKKIENEKDKLSSLITTEEGLKLCTKIGASAYVECSAKLNIGVDEVFKTALKLTIKHPLFVKMDMCNLS